MQKQIMVVLVPAVIATLMTLMLSGCSQSTDQAAIEQAVLKQLSAHLAEHDAVASESKPPVVLRVTEELLEDAWLRGRNRSGEPRPGPADDAKPIADASNSICYLTKVEFLGGDSQEDTVSCGVTIDEFTGWWQVNAIQADSSDASVRCNARCLVWE